MIKKRVIREFIVWGLALLFVATLVGIGFELGISYGNR